MDVLKGTGQFWPFFAFLQAAQNAQRELGEGHLSASSDLFVNEISLLY